MNELFLTKYRFTLQFTEAARLPPFAGNTIRGALGQALYDNFRPVYDTVFKAAGSESIPKPFVISVPFPSKGAYAAGETLTFCVTLLGTACDFAQDIISAVNLMCKGKLANTTLASAENVYSREWRDSGTETIPYCDVLTVRFITPTEILRKSMTEPDFEILIDSLFGRISGVIDNYTDSQFIIPYSLIASKPFVKPEYNLQAVRLQTNGQPINGFIGTVRYFGDVTRYLPYIDLGSQIHIGKKTTRACGEYEFQI